MALLRLRRAAQITLPAELRKALHVEEGDYLEARLVEGGVLLSPVAVVDRDKSWREFLDSTAELRTVRRKSRRSQTAVEEEIVKEIKAHRRGHD